jgi:hypothetical protein
MRLFVDTDDDTRLIRRSVLSPSDCGHFLLTDTTARSQA